MQLESIPVPHAEPLNNCVRTIKAHLPEFNHGFSGLALPDAADLAVLIASPHGLHA